MELTALSCRCSSCGLCRSSKSYNCRKENLVHKDCVTAQSFISFWLLSMLCRSLLSGLMPLLQLPQTRSEPAAVCQVITRNMEGLQFFYFFSSFFFLDFSYFFFFLLKLPYPSEHDEVTLEVPAFPYMIHFISGSCLHSNMHHHSLCFMFRHRFSKHF